MEPNELDTEQRILEAAEAEFVKNGFLNAKTVNIAERAGVSHSMLHYYFRTKEKLFQTVYAEKIKVFSSLFDVINEKNLDFFDTIKLFIEIQFDFMSKHPKFPFFMLNEVLSNKENRRLLFETIACKEPKVGRRIEEMMKEEIKKGTIREMIFPELMLDIVSLNVAFFIAFPILEEWYPAVQEIMPLDKALAERKQHVIDFVLNAIKNYEKEK